MIRLAKEYAATEEAAVIAAKNSAESFIDLLWEQYELETGNPQYDEADPDNTARFFKWHSSKSFKDHTV